MLERISSTTRRVRRGRPMTFAATRPLSPRDLSGITGLLADTAEVTPAPAAGRSERRTLMATVRQWLQGLTRR